ncbi:hypothetical protein KUTeg_006254 [Tegillarca granosa]|uniref:Uncharacterized protein n=1 Tax=Tegillarca granosa TaxID=220873 RepID=A0ABQ9FIY5_TEGGR|nr:hypothetical protein KUTeg_006254 [Tegillarca granosa]
MNIRIIYVHYCSIFAVPSSSGNNASLLYFYQWVSLDKLPRLLHVLFLYICITIYDGIYGQPYTCLYDLCTYIISFASIFLPYIELCYQYIITFLFIFSLCFAIK